jgi:hypothetical protein
MAGAGSKLVDRLVPAYPITVPGGPAFVIYAVHKYLRWKGTLACPLIDPLIPKKSSGPFTYVSIGDPNGPEAIPTLKVPWRLNWIEFLVSLLLWERQDWTDWRFCVKVFSSIDLTAFSCLRDRLKARGALGKLITTFLCRLWALRTFLIAKYVSLKFRAIASRCSEAYVVVYYSAMMLGVVRAFRRLGKPVWDVQHGYIGPTHGAYDNKEAFRLTSTFQPSGYLVWDRRFGRLIEKATGAQWESTDYLHLRAYCTTGRSGDARFTVLYSLQYDTPVPDAVERAVRELPHIHWVFRMHPMDRDRQRKDLDRFRALPNVSIESASEPLALVLGNVDLHITYNSGLGHEAAALGIPSLILDHSLLDRYGEELARGLAIPVEPDQLSSVLKHFYGIRKKGG